MPEVSTEAYSYRAIRPFHRSTTVGTLFVVDGVCVLARAAPLGHAL